MSVPFKVIIPARFSSTRLPGKPLRLLAGRSMIGRVWDLAMASGADEVIVATDDERIVSEVARLGGKAVMTSGDHVTGTDRLAEVVSLNRWSKDTVVVNLQGDEPCIPAALLREVATALSRREAVGIATVATPICDVAELFSDNIVKVVVNGDGIASYFSRAPIPWVRGIFCPASMPSFLPDNIVFLRHLGLYAYRVGALTRLSANPQNDTELAESLEQLRAIAMGIPVHVTVIDNPPIPGVDIESDILRVEREILGS